MSSQRHRFGPFELDVARHQLTRDGVPIEVQPKPMALLVRLVSDPDRLHARQEIAEALWPDTIVTEQSLRQVVFKLREALGDQAELVQTVPRVGVRLAVPVERSAPVTAGLPRERGAFVGRREELAAVGARGPGVRTLVGPGGVGKTRLAVRSAHAFDGGPVVFAELAETRTDDDVLGAVAAALGVPRLADLAGRVVHAIAARGPCLVVLDNAEQVREAVAARVVAWTAGAPEARFLVTSRMALGIPGEAVIAVAPLPEFDGAALFRTRARRPDGDPEVVEALVRALDGLPLAIELAAAAGRDLPLDELLRQLSDRFGLLVRDGEGRHDALATTLAWSWDLLSADERAGLGQLAVFVGGFSLEAAEAVLDVGEVDAADVIASLRAQSLVHAVQGDRADLLISVREFVLARLDARERSRAEAHHGAYFAAFGSESALGSLLAGGGVERRRAWSADLDNLVAAARRGDGPVACGAALAVAELTRRSGPLGLALELLEAALASSGPERERIRVALSAGRVLLELGRSDEARPRLETVRTWAAARDPRLEAEALQALAQVEHDGGRPDSAMARIRSALALVPSGGVLEARLRSTAGGVAMYQGRLPEAIAELERAADGHRAAGDLLNEARTVLNLAVALGQAGEIARSGERYQEALVQLRAAGDRVGLGVALSSAAGWCDKVGRADEARVYLESALSLARELGDRRAEAIALVGLGRCRAVADPRPPLEAALAILEPLGWDYGLTFALCGLVRVELRSGHPEAALARADAAVARAGRYPNLRVMALVERATVHLEAGRLEAAGADLAEARTLGVGGLDGATRAVIEAKLAVARGEPDLAEAALAEACRDPALVTPTSELGEEVAALRAALRTVECAAGSTKAL